MEDRAAVEDIEFLRSRIEELDSGILRLLGERFAHVRLLGRWNARAEPERDAELRALYLHAAQREGLDPLLVLRVFDAVQEHSRAVLGGEVRRPLTA